MRRRDEKSKANRPSRESEIENVIIFERYETLCQKSPNYVDFPPKRYYGHAIGHSVKNESVAFWEFCVQKLLAAKYMYRKSVLLPKMTVIIVIFK